MDMHANIFNGHARQYFLMDTHVRASLPDNHFFIADDVDALKQSFQSF